MTGTPQTPPRHSFPPIEDHGVIGDLHTVALVDLSGTIDFLCFPHFDSPSIFAKLLDRERGGSFELAPVGDGAHTKQIYMPDSNVLLTRFLFQDGVAEVSDFMPVEEAGYAHNLVRRAKAINGEMRFRVRCRPRFDYGRAGCRVERREGCYVLSSDGDDGTVVHLRSEVPLSIGDGEVSGEFTLRAGESAGFVLEDGSGGFDTPCRAEDYVADSFKNTLNFWRRWIGRCTYHGRWREMVYRSALVLKLLVSQPHGSIVAAPTFGLPETIGGGRNWDYRYTWIRDASFTLYALTRLGFTSEAKAFMEWLAERCGEIDESGGLQVMYGIDGRTDLTEHELPHLSGYRGSRPVRIGNGAYDQLQLDIYGELMDAVYLYDKYGERISYDLWTKLVPLIDWVCDNWRRPDEGIWEVRGGRHEFLFSRVLCWVAVDRGVRLARKRSLPAPHLRWIETRDAIYRDVFENFWDPGRQAFVQHKGAETLDAGALILPLVRFIAPTDRRFRSTLAAIERELVEDSLVHRYRLDGRFVDGLEGREGTFNMCSFWYVECVSRTGDLEKARFYFDKMMGYANHLGLFGEELGPRGEHLGNFPQAFTHMGLISAAYDLDRRLSRSGREG